MLAARLARSLLRISFALYLYDVARARFPQDAPPRVIDGPDSTRLLFVGDVAAAGYGVLREGLTAPSRIAAIVAADTGSGCSWDVVARPDFTVGDVVALPPSDPGRLDCVVVMIGIPDVLMFTSEAEWLAGLWALTRRVRRHTGEGCRLVFAGIPPMTEFRYVPKYAIGPMRRQIERLNRATETFVCGAANALYVPFPDRRVDDMFYQQTFSWKTMHQMWAEAIAPACVDGDVILAAPVREAVDIEPDPV